MNSADNESEEKEFCLFHEQIGCVCEVPVTNKATLIYRLIQEIKANNFLNLESTDKEANAKRQKEIDAYHEWLDKLTKVF
jgi:hypothetical protein